MAPEQVRAFREDYRAQKIPADYRGWDHLLLTSAICLTIVGLALSRIERLEWLELLAVPVAWLIANLIEYGVHRGFQHRPRPPLELLYQRHTLEHHRFFTREVMAIDHARDFRATLFPIWIGLCFTLPIAGAVALVAGWLLGPDLGLLVHAALVFYYLIYEWAHLGAHMPEHSLLGRMPGIAFARKHHGRHHDPRHFGINFNFAIPIGDWLFRTLERQRH
ncbi:MAG: sterol desaturase family protein [Enhygromyxa sp.]